MVEYLQGRNEANGLDEMVASHFSITFKFSEVLERPLLSHAFIKADCTARCMILHT